MIYRILRHVKSPEIELKINFLKKLQFFFRNVLVFSENLTFFLKWLKNYPKTISETHKPLES
jgi:hypothetical protein